MIAKKTDEAWKAGYEYVVGFGWWKAQALANTDSVYLVHVSRGGSMQVSMSDCVGGKSKL